MIIRKNTARRLQLSLSTPSSAGMSFVDVSSDQTTMGAVTVSVFVFFENFALASSALT